MKKSFFNRHKIKRKVKRRARSLRNSLDATFFEGKRAKRRDFSWKGRACNPHVRRKKRVNKKLRVQVVLLGVSLFATLWLVLFHSLFYITPTSISGLQRIPESEIHNAITATLDYKKIGIFPQQNFFFADLDTLGDVLKSRFSIEDVVLKKQFPNKLLVTIEEKISTIIYDNGKFYSYLNLGGDIVEKIKAVGEHEWKKRTEVVTSTNSGGEVVSEERVLESIHTPDTKSVRKTMGDYPIVFDTRNKNSEVNEHVLQQGTVAGIVEWFNTLHRNTDIVVNYFTIENDLGSIDIRTREGWHIKSRTSNIEEQFADLQTILQEKIDRSKVSYIDLRYPGRVYWQ